MVIPPHVISPMQRIEVHMLLLLIRKYGLAPLLGCICSLIEVSMSLPEDDTTRKAVVSYGLTALRSASVAFRSYEPDFQNIDLPLHVSLN